MNEGLVELPPSPWRILRALYAVWQLRAPDLDESIVVDLLGDLAQPPVFHVPPFQLGHTRHWYPDSTHRSGEASIDKTFDAFAVLNRRSELAVVWPFTLPPEQHKALDRLASALPYLGRADSLCEAELREGWSPTRLHRVSAPLDLDEQPDEDTVGRLAPTLPLNVEALLARPVDIRTKQRLLFPPGSRLVAYQRVQPSEPRRVTRRRQAQAVTAVRFTITAPVLPPLTDAIYLTDRLRAAALKKLGTERGGQPAWGTLAGKSADGVPQTGHAHAHYLALPSSERRIEELAVWAPRSLLEEELRALTRITRLWASEQAPGPGSVDVRVSAYGPANDVLGELSDAAEVWQSVTPYIPSRHCKIEWPDFVASEIARELSYRELPAASDVHLIDTTDWRTFARRRPSGRRRNVPLTPAGVQIIFSEPVPGPLALGALSHFGMGLFLPRHG